MNLLHTHWKPHNTSDKYFILYSVNWKTPFPTVGMPEKKNTKLKGKETGVLSSFATIILHDLGDFIQSSQTGIIANANDGLYNLYNSLFTPHSLTTVHILMRFDAILRPVSRTFFNIYFYLFAVPVLVVACGIFSLYCSTGIFSRDLAS